MISVWRRLTRKLSTSSTGSIMRVDEHARMMRRLWTAITPSNWSLIRQWAKRVTIAPSISQTAFDLIASRRMAWIELSWLWTDKCQAHRSKYVIIIKIKFRNKNISFYIYVSALFTSIPSFIQQENHIENLYMLVLLVENE